MALKKCKECGEQVSTQAKTCPRCGAKAPTGTSLFTWFVLVVVVLVGYSIIQSPTTAVNTTSTTRAGRPLTAAGGSQRTTPVEPAWTQFTSKDEMTGASQAFATSPRVSSKSRMEFPYGDTQAWMAMGCDGKSEWAYIGFTNAPNLNDTDTEDGYNVVRTRVRWNDAVENTYFTQQWGAAFLHFRDDRSAIAKMAASNSVLLELDWHGQRPVYFEFPLRGSSAAIGRVRELCGSYN